MSPCIVNTMSSRPTLKTRYMGVYSFGEWHLATFSKGNWLGFGQLVLNVIYFFRKETKCD